MDAFTDINRVWPLLITASILLLPLSLILNHVKANNTIQSISKTHNKIGVPPSSTALKDQWQPIHTAPGPGRLHSLFIYPLKSCRGIELSRSKVLPTGLESDRLYTFAQLREGGDGVWKFLTQRDLPLLASVQVDLWASKTGESHKGGVLVVSFPWRQKGLLGVAQQLGLTSKEKQFALPIDFPSAEEIKNKAYTFADVKIWTEITTALNMENELPPELTRYLGCKHRMALFRMDPSRQREVFRCAPKMEDIGYQPIVDFHDAYPLHMQSLSSIRDLESRIEDKSFSGLDARRFRSNMIITGTDSYAEETWKQIKFGETSHFAVSCRTVRCKMPNVHQETGQRHRSEPDRSLRMFRDVDEGAPKMGCLGMQLCPLFPQARSAHHLEASLEVGMELEIMEEGEHLYIDQE